MKSKKYFLSLALLLGLIVWGLSSQSIKIVQAAVKTTAANKAALVKKSIVKKPIVKKPITKKPITKKIPVKKAAINKPIIKKPIVKKTTNSLTWDASGIKQLNRITNPIVRTAYKTKVEKYALGKKIKTITAAVVNGMHE